MVYIPLSTVNYNDDWEAADHEKVRGNFIASVPDIFTAKGDVAVGTGATTLAAVAGVAGQILQADSGEASGVKWSFGHIPVGGIIMWSAALGGLPSNWQICDGTNGTVDLRNKFVAGAGSTYGVGDTGGSITSSWSHTHSLSGTTGTDGGHTHTFTVSAEAAHQHQLESDDYVGSSTTNNEGSQVDGSHYHKFSLQAASHTHTNRNGATSSAGSHSHTVSRTSNSSGSGSLNILPPYYALAYIQRIL